MFLEWWPKLTFSIFAWNKIWLVNHFLYSIGHRRSNYLWKNCLLEQLTLFQESILQSFLWYYLNNTFSVFLGVGLIHILAFYTHTRAELCNERIHKNKSLKCCKKLVGWTNTCWMQELLKMVIEISKFSWWCSLISGNLN